MARRSSTSLPARRSPASRGSAPTAPPRPASPRSPGPSPWRGPRSASGRTRSWWAGWCPGAATPAITRAAAGSPGSATRWTSPTPSATWPPIRPRSSPAPSLSPTAASPSTATPSPTPRRRPAVTDPPAAIALAPQVPLAGDKSGIHRERDAGDVPGVVADQVEDRVADVNRLNEVDGHQVGDHLGRLRVVLHVLAEYLVEHHGRGHAGG